MSVSTPPIQSLMIWLNVLKGLFIYVLILLERQKALKLKYVLWKPVFACLIKER